MKKEFYCRIRGDEIGPIDIAQVKKLLAVGTMGLKDEIRKGADGAWRPVSRIPKLKALMKAPHVENPKPGELPTSEPREADNDGEQPSVSRNENIASSLLMCLAGVGGGGFGLAMALRDWGTLKEPLMETKWFRAPTMLMTALGIQPEWFIVLVCGGLILVGIAAPVAAFTEASGKRDSTTDN